MTAIPQEGTSSNRYLIIGRLAGGGMADIFLARSTNEAGVERYVVLKRVLAERSRDPQFATMFLDEARLAAQLQHPNIAQVHDIGKLAGSYFYTMEYVHGEDLRHVLMRLFALRRSFPLPLVLHVASGALAGLHHAHTRTSRDGTPLGVVHRDVTPSNIMVSYEGHIKVLDFGVAKATQRSTESRSGTIKGKIAYLSPEQCQGHAIDRRSDLYALGIVLHEMLTGRRLYKRDTDFATMAAIVQEPVTPPSAQRSDVSPELDRIVLTALEKDPARRFATAADMIEAIEELAQREHHVMSGTALGKFMRELFGDRPEPWLELAVREEDTKPITVTGESIVGLDPLAGAVPIAMSRTPSGGHLVAESLAAPAPTGSDAEIQQQLDHAPAIGRASEAASTSVPRAETDDPTARAVPRADANASGSLPGLAPVTAASPAPASRSSGPTPSPSPAPASPSSGPSPSPAPVTAASPAPASLPSGPTPSPSPAPVPSSPISSPPTPSSGMRLPIVPITTVGIAPPPVQLTPAHISVPGAPAYPTAPPEMMAEYRGPKDAPPRAVPVWRRRVLVIAATAALLVVAILAVVKLTTSGSDRTHVVAPSSDRADTGSASGSATSPDTAGSDSTNRVTSGSTSTGSDTTHASGSDSTGSDTMHAVSGSDSTGSDTMHAVSGSDSTGSDTMHAVSGSDSTGSDTTQAASRSSGPDSAHARSGSSAGSAITPDTTHTASGSGATPDTTHAASGSGRGSASGSDADRARDSVTLERCAAMPPTTAADRARCGVAACNLKQRSVAFGYWSATAGAGQQLVERACKDRGIVLRPRAPANPCTDKRYREENPLKCQ